MKKIINQIKKKLIYLSLFFVLSSLHGFGQMISRAPGDYPAGTIFNSSCPGTGCEITLPALKLGETGIYTLPLLVTAPDNIYTSNISGSCTQVSSSYTISNVVNDITVQITDKCPSGSSTLSFTLRVEKSGNVPDNQRYHVPIERDMAKIALVLDISGSMSLNVQGTSDTRIQELKNAVNVLVPKLELFRQENDSLAMTYFSSNVIQPNPTYFPTDFIKIDNSDVVEDNWSSSKVYYDINPRVPLQMTALGEGLIDAKNKLDKDNSPNLRRMVFLFTDGLQNYGNQLKTDGLTFYGSLDSLNNYSTNPKDSIYYFPVATWAAGDQPEIFQNIVNANKGEVLFVTPSSGLQTWFNNQLVNMLDDGSPQIVMEKSANHIPGEINYTFSLNGNINTVAIELSTKADIDMGIFKDGIDITSKGRITAGSNFNLISFTFPIITNPVIHSGGEWSIILNGDSQESYDLAVIADDHFSNYDCSVNKSTFTVGDSIHFKTKLEYMGTPITGSTNNVKAILLKPGDDLGHLLSVYETPDFDTIADIDSDVANKFNELMANDSAFFNALLPDEQIIDLTNNGNGEFTGYYANTELAGIYNVIYLINGEIPNNGKLQRTKTLSTIFVFGQIEEEEPEVVNDAPPASSGNNQKYTVLKIRPKNKFGYYMGPGFKSKIKVKINTKRSKPQKTSITNVSNNTQIPYLEEIRDNLDGSYYLYLTNLDDSEKWDIAIEIRGEVLYDYSDSIPYWVYILALILLLLALVLKKAGKIKVLFWILLIIWLIIIIFHYFGYLNLF